MRLQALLFSAALLLTLPPTIPLAAEVVDLELVIAVDVGGSEDVDQAIERQGYVDALRASEVLTAVKSGPLGKIAVTYIEFASYGFQKVVVPWRVIGNARDALALADELQSTPINHEASGLGTSISGGIAIGIDAFFQTPVGGDRRAIDVSGDGPNNSGLPITRIRDAAVADGITINGLPVLLRADPTYGMNGIIRLDDYYAGCVIGGAGSFALPVEDLGQFAEAIQRKLVLEIAGPAMPVAPVATPSSPPSVDCRADENPGGPSRSP